MARLMLSLGMFSALAAAIAVRRRGLLSGSPPPAFAAMVISLISWVNILPRLASSAPFLCLMVAHFEWPDMATSSSLLIGNCGAKGRKKRDFRCMPATLEYSTAHGSASGGRSRGAAVVVPFPGTLRVQGGGVFRQDPALADQLINSSFVAGKVVVAAGVALGDGRAWIARGLAFS